MNISGERIIVFGDSLSHHGATSSPDVWDVNLGSSRTSSAPGDLLASMLAENGAQAVRVNARVGRSGISFLHNEPAQALLAADAQFRPTKVIVIMGTNDVGRNLATDLESYKAIKAQYGAMGAEVWAIGPLTYLNSTFNDGAPAVIDMMHKVFGSRFIDGRMLSVQEGRAGDGIHFGSTAARATAENMLRAVQAASSFNPWWLVGGAFAIVGGMALWSWRRRHTRSMAIAGMHVVDGKRWNGSDKALIRSGAYRVPCKSGIKSITCWETRGHEIRGIDGDPISPDGNTPSDEGFIYHVTNQERAYDIAKEGLNTHEPWDFTDQEEWPDGTTERRSYFAPRASSVWAFAPEEGKPVILRTRMTKEIKRESTGDLYATKKLPANRFEILTTDGWEPLAQWSAEETGLKGKKTRKGGHEIRGIDGRKPFKISTKDPATMTASQINKELDKLSDQDSTLGDEMIAAGRGHERPSEYLKMEDPLSRELRANSDRRQALRIEMETRYGPGAPSRLPTDRRGWYGPRKKLEGLGGERRGLFGQQEDIAEIAKDAALEDDYDRAEKILSEGKPRKIRIAFTKMTPESAGSGDVSERGWVDEEGDEIEIDANDIEDAREIEDVNPITQAVVTKTVKWLRNRGAYEPSSSEYDPNLWYSSNFEITDYSTGEEEQEDYFLDNFTPEEKKAIFEAFTGRPRSDGTYWRMRRRKSLKGLDLTGPKKPGHYETSADEYATYSMFKRLMQDPDPRAMSIIEDMLLEKGAKLSRITRSADPNAGMIVLDADAEHPTRISWSIEAGSKKSSGKGYNYKPFIEIVYRGRKLKSIGWNNAGESPTRAKAIKHATAAAWAIAKDLKQELATDTSAHDVEHKFHMDWAPSVRRAYIEPGSKTYPSLETDYMKNKELFGFRVAYREAAIDPKTREVVNYRHLIRDDKSKVWITPSLAQAEKIRRKYKNRTAWIEDENGNFVPVKGAKRPMAFDRDG